MERVVFKEMITKTRYVAIDGTEFVDEEKCQTYEQSLECSLAASWNKIPKSEMNTYDLFLGEGAEDCSYVIFKPRNLDDINVMNMYMHLQGGDMVSTDDIGKAIWFYCNYDGEYFRQNGTFIDDIVNHYNQLCTNVDEFGEYKCYVQTDTLEKTINANCPYDLDNSIKRLLRQGHQPGDTFIATLMKTMADNTTTTVQYNVHYNSYNDIKLTPIIPTEEGEADE